MDPLTAFSLAGTVIQVVDFTAKLISTTRQISATGARSDYLNIEQQTLGFQRFLEALQPGIAIDPTKVSQSQRDLWELCKQGEEISQRMLSVLRGCHSAQSGDTVSLDTFWRAVKSEWHYADLRELQSKLNQISSRAQPLIVKSNHADLIQRLSNLEVLLQGLGANRSADLQRLQKAIEELPRSDENSSSSLNLIRNSMTDSGLVHKGHDYMVEAGILGQLRFRDIDRRLQQLEQRPAHRKSYLWMHENDQDDSKQGRTPTNFRAWLKSDSKFYWVTGKPGSGKSTLMKFLYQDPPTREALRTWASGHDLLVAAYFFWEVGKVPLLRTREGLLRTLLFQILRQQPDLIKKVYTDLWSFYGSTVPLDPSQLHGFSGFEVPTDYMDLVSRMRTACQTLATSGTHLCLFIDGLDEYNGKEDDIIDLLNVFVSVQNVKICASSRPENAFIEAWEKAEHKLYMETFNHADISAYVRGTLEEDVNYREMDDQDTARASLVNEIVSHAKGVFLWVYLVILELKEGLRNKDTIGQLQSRLNQLPKDLEKFFTQILSRVPEFYRQRSAGMFLVTLNAVDLLPVIACWYISEGSPELDKTHEAKKASMQSNNKRRKAIQARLNADCRGLLEIQHQSLPASFETLASSTLYSHKVNFLHRTVREFLSEPEPSQLLSSWLPAPIDTDEVICKALLAQISTSPIEAEYFLPDGPVAALVDTFVHHSNELKTRSRDAVAGHLLENLVSVLSSQRLVNGNDLVFKLQNKQSDSTNSVESHPTESQAVLPSGSKPKDAVPKPSTVKGWLTRKMGTIRSRRIES